MFKKVTSEVFWLHPDLNFEYNRILVPSFNRSIAIKTKIYLNLLHALHNINK